MSSRSKVFMLSKSDVFTRSVVPKAQYYIFHILLEVKIGLDSNHWTGLISLIEN